MKKIYGILMASVALLSGAGLQSCTSDEPFGTDGEGLLRMKMVINSTVTRDGLDQQALADSCIIYLSDAQGLIYKYKGLDQVPSDLYLKSGNYVAEAWTGDSVSASWDKKFYRAYEPFTIQKGDVKNVILNCRIANVVASVNPEPIIEQLLHDYTLTIGHSRDSLVFDQSNILTNHAYFMMPNADKDLHWTLQGKDEAGQDFVKTGIIKDVQRAHEYVLNIKYTQGGSQEIGGGFITVTIDDQENIIEENVEITAAPAITGMGFDLDEGINSMAGKVDRRSVYIQALGSLTALDMTVTNYTAFGLPTGAFDLIGAEPEALQTLHDAGLDWEINYNAADNYTTAKVSMSAAMLNGLPNGEYAVTYKATDSYGKSRTKTLNINISEEKVMIIETPATEVKSYSTTLYGSVTDETMTNPGFRFRPVGSADWQTVAAEMTRSYTIYAHITNLQPNTKYEYQVFADGYLNPKVANFTTDGVFVLPNSSFEDWSEDTNGLKDNAMIPGAGGKATFWDSGNHGTHNLIGDITTGSTDMAHSGSKSARLQSAYASVFGIGRFAAGNMFAGSYDKTAGTSAELTFGRAFDGSHPVKLRGWINYRPGTVDQTKGTMIQKNAQDQGHIFVALCTQSYSINPANNRMFDKNSSSVLAYGELLLTGNYGPDGELQQFEITLDYRDAAQYAKAGYIVLVCTASRYGDYFEGSTNSVLYIDDLELVYE